MVSIKKKEYRRKEREKWWGLIRFSTRSTLRLFENPILYPFHHFLSHFLFLSLSFLLFFPSYFLLPSNSFLIQRERDLPHWWKLGSGSFSLLSSSLFCFFSLFTHSCRFLPAIHYPSGWKRSSKVMLCVSRRRIRQRKDEQRTAAKREDKKKKEKKKKRPEEEQEEEERTRMEGWEMYTSKVTCFITRRKRDILDPLPPLWLLHPEFLLCLTHLISCLPRLHSNSFLLHFHLQKARREIVRDERGRDWMRERKREGMQGFNVRALFQTWGFILSHFVVSNLLPGTGSELLLTIRVESRRERKERGLKKGGVLQWISSGICTSYSSSNFDEGYSNFAFIIPHHSFFLLIIRKEENWWWSSWIFSLVLHSFPLSISLSFVVLFSLRDLNPPTNKVKEEPAVIITCYSSRTCIHFLLLLLFHFLLLPIFLSRLNHSNKKKGSLVGGWK